MITFQEVNLSPVFRMRFHGNKHTRSEFEILCWIRYPCQNSRCLWSLWIFRSFKNEKGDSYLWNTYFLVTFTWWVVNGNLTNNSRSEKKASEIILAKISPNLEQVVNAKQLTSWAELCPASYKNGGVRKSAHISAGNKYLKKPYFNNTTEIRDPQVT